MGRLWIVLSSALFERMASIKEENSLGANARRIKRLQAAVSRLKKRDWGVIYIADTMLTKVRGVPFSDDEDTAGSYGTAGARSERLLDLPLRGGFTRSMPVGRSLRVALTLVVCAAMISSSAKGAATQMGVGLEGSLMRLMRLGG